MKHILILFFLLPFIVSAQLETTDANNPVPKDNFPAKKNWFENFSVRGYLQVRYNRLLETNPNLKCEQCDKSWGNNGGVFIRRARIIFYGQINKRVYFYIQPDFASASSSTNLNFGQMRDAYMDLGLDNDNTFRFRLGQSKIPFGFENMQSSQNRLPLDRNDGINSAFANERDLGAFFYWAPKHTRKTFSMVNKQGLKGSGDYGVFGFGVFNGQTANKPELNNNLHVVARLSYPFTIGNQLIEPGIQAYTGLFEIPVNQITAGVLHHANRNYRDERMAATFVLYPKPFGIQAEYNFGRGPEYHKFTNAIITQNLHGGYATLNYKIDLENHTIYPFIRYQYYNGGKKHELDARSYEVKELENGVEWAPNKNFELVVMYTISERRFEDALNKNNLQKGSLMRIQAQINF